MLEAGSNAVLAHLRGYSEHIQKLALPFSKLDIAGICRSWGLLKSPNVKETRGMAPKQKDWWADPAEVGLPALPVKKDDAAADQSKQRRKHKKGKKSGKQPPKPRGPVYRWPVPDTSVVRFLDPERETARQLRL